MDVEYVHYRIYHETYKYVKHIVVSHTQICPSYVSTFSHHFKIASFFIIMNLRLFGLSFQTWTYWAISHYWLSSLHIKTNCRSTIDVQSKYTWLINCINWLHTKHFIEIHFFYRSICSFLFFFGINCVAIISKSLLKLRNQKRRMVHLGKVY